MSDWPEIYVLRHGQTEWNTEGRHQGRLDSGLTQLGRSQATAQGRILRAAGLADCDIDIVASPQGRAWTTAEIVLAEIGKTARSDDRLVEIKFGDWQGLRFSEIEAGWPEMNHHKNDWEWHFTAPGGESFDALAARARAFLNSLTGPAVVVTHGITSKAIRGLWLGLDRAGMGALPGGQGIVYHLENGGQICLEEATSPV